MAIVKKSSGNCKANDYESHIHSGHAKGNMFEGEKVQHPKLYEKSKSGYPSVNEDDHGVGNNN